MKVALKVALSQHTFTIWGICCLVEQCMPSKPGKYGIKSGQHAKLGSATPGTCRCTSATLLVERQERTRVCVGCVCDDSWSQKTQHHMPQLFYFIHCQATMASKDSQETQLFSTGLGTKTQTQKNKNLIKTCH